MEQNTKKIHSIWRQIYLNNGCFFERFCCTDVSSIFRSFFTRARCQYCSVSSIFYLFIYYFNQAQERKRTKKNVYEKRITLLWCKIFASVLTFVFFSFFFLLWNSGILIQFSMLRHAGGTYHHGSHSCFALGIFASNLNAIRKYFWCSNNNQVFWLVLSESKRRKNVKQCS